MGFEPARSLSFPPWGAAGRRIRGTWPGRTDHLPVYLFRINWREWEYRIKAASSSDTPTVPEPYLGETETAEFAEHPSLQRWEEQHKEQAICSWEGWHTHTPLVDLRWETGIAPAVAHVRAYFESVAQRLYDPRTSVVRALRKDDPRRDYLTHAMLLRFWVLQAENCERALDHAGIPEARSRMGSPGSYIYPELAEFVHAAEGMAREAWRRRND